MMLNFLLQMTTKTAVDRVDRTVKTTSLPDSDSVVHATATQSLPESREVQKKSTMEDSTSEEPKTKVSLYFLSDIFFVVVYTGIDTRRSYDR